MALDDFTTYAFTYQGQSRAIYRRGSGPGIVLLHVLPGIIPAVVRLADRVAAAGFTVFMPHLFGVPGKPLTRGYLYAQAVRVCLRREFHALAARKSSPVTEWLRALCRHAHQKCGGPGVGVVGMCFTGGFALAMMVEPAVMAPVVCQPVLPMFAFTRDRKAALGLSPDELAAAAARARAGIRVLGLRFTNDPLCPREKFDTLRRELGDGFEAMEIDSSEGNPHGISRHAHAVLTDDFVDRDGHPTREALDRVLTVLRERLYGGAEGG